VSSRQNVTRRYPPDRNSLIAPPGLIHHTARGVTCSMRRAGACLDNATEGFFAPRKAALVVTHRE